MMPKKIVFEQFKLKKNPQILENFVFLSSQNINFNPQILKIAKIENLHKLFIFEYINY